MIFRPHKRPGLLAALVLNLSVLTGQPGIAGGVPITDPIKTLQERLKLLEEGFKREEQIEKSAKNAEKSDLHDEQLEALRATIAQLTSSNLNLASLEGAGGFSAGEVYAIDDNNPYSERLFGDARVTIEQMIIETARNYGGHPALARAGINPTEFRVWFQSLIKQESGFSIGARSNKAAFGLTQIIPGTAKYLGIYPAYYSDPRLQLSGGARYLLEQLSKFGSMDLALAAYNAGPGAVIKYGGIPPYKETQNYVRSIRAHYNKYAVKISGVDSLGTLSPSDMARAELSNISDAGLHYGMFSTEILVQSLSRVEDLLRRVPTTSTVLEAMQLNAYLRAEVTRMTYVLARLNAAQRQIEAARFAPLFAAYARDEEFLNLRRN